MPFASVGRDDLFANSMARSSTFCSNLERGTSSSINFQFSARLPRIPSVTVQK